MVWGGGVGWQSCPLAWQVLKLHRYLHVSRRINPTFKNGSSHHSCCDWELCWCPWLVFLPATMLRFMVHAASEAMLISMTCATAESHSSSIIHAVVESHVYFHGLYCHWRPCWGLWSRLPPEVMWMSMVHAAAGNHVEVHDPCHHLLRRIRKLLLQWYG